MEICIDFDGTCVTHEFPKVGKEIGAPAVLKKLVESGHKLILFTMRSDVVNPNSSDPAITNAAGPHLTEAIEWFKKHGIELYGVQTNPTQHEWTTSPKAYGQLYIDDAGLNCPLLYPGEENYVQTTGNRPHVDWKWVEVLLKRKGLFKKQ